MRNKSKSPSRQPSLLSKDINEKNIILSEYINSNLLSFQYLKQKNYKLAIFTFEKNIEIAKNIDELKYIESLLNLGSTLFIYGEFEQSFNNFQKAKDLSSNLLSISENVTQIYFIHLRILSNLSLITLSLNNITYSKELFEECISLIKSNKINDILIQISLLRELVYIFFRIDSLNKYSEVNTQLINNNDIYFNSNTEEFISNFDSEIKIDSDSLINFHRSIHEKNITYWIEYLNKQIIKNKNKTTDVSGMLFLIINQIAALYCSKLHEDNMNIKSAVDYLLNYYKQSYHENLGMNEKELIKLLNDYKIRFETIIEYYDILLELEEEIKYKFQINNKNNKISSGSENKILIKLLFRHALNIFEEKKCNNKEIKKQIEYAMKLIETNNLNWKLISLINIDSDIIKSLKILFSNLSIIKNKFIVKNYFFKFKFKTLGYFNIKEMLIKKYIKSDKYFLSKFESLDDGSVLLKCNYGTKGFIEHYYKISYIKGEYCLLVFKNINEIKPYKVFRLAKLYNITVGLKTENLINKINQNLLKNYKPWFFLSFWFPERTIDINFDNDEEMNKWFEGIYYYSTRIDKPKKNKISLCQYFFSKAKLKLLYTIKYMKYNLPIIEQLHYYESQNELEYLSLPFSKTILLYTKINKVINKKK